MNNERTYVFDINWTNNFPGRDSFLKAGHFNPFCGSVYLSTPFWPFSMQRPPKILSTGRTKPIKARILEWDDKARMIKFSLERYITVEDNIKKYPVTRLKDTLFWIDFESI